MVVMPINKLILNVFWGNYLDMGVVFGANTFQKPNYLKKRSWFCQMASGNLLNLRTILSEEKLLMEHAGYGLRHTSLGDSHVIPIFSVAKNLNVNKTFSRDVKALYLIESEDSSFLIKQSLCHWQRNQAWASLFQIGILI